MNENQIMNIYNVNGIPDFKLKDTKDLLRIHGIEFKEIEGYEELDDINRLVYMKFIVNFFNAQGLLIRSNIKPIGVYYVEHVENLIKDPPEDESYTVSGSIVYSLDRNGCKKLLHIWQAECYKNIGFVKQNKYNYLRFEYEINGALTWLHVSNEYIWY